MASTLGGDDPSHDLAPSEKDREEKGSRREARELLGENTKKSAPRNLDKPTRFRVRKAGEPIEALIEVIVIDPKMADVGSIPSDADRRLDEAVSRGGSSSSLGPSRKAAVQVSVRRRCTICSIQTIEHFPANFSRRLWVELRTLATSFIWMGFRESQGRTRRHRDIQGRRCSPSA